MRTVKVRCRGVSPLLMDRMTDETLEELRTGVRAQKSKDRPKRDVAREKIYRENGDGSTIGFPQECLFSCLVAAGRNVKNGKKQISTAKTTTLPDFLTIREFFIPLTNINGKKDEEKYWEPDSRRGRLQDGTAVCVVRPKFRNWEFEITIDYDEKKADKSVIRALFDNAGSAQGLGSFRPNCKGPFGRFEVVGWIEVSSDGAAKNSKTARSVKGRTTAPKGKKRALARA